MVAEDTSVIIAVRADRGRLSRGVAIVISPVPPTVESVEPVRHPGRVAAADTRQPKAMRIIVGVMLMAAFVLITFGLITRYAGGWGVPFFSFTSERGSTCTNNFTGYTCDPLTLADVEFYSEVDLPGDTRVVTAAATPRPTTTRCTPRCG